MTISVLNAEQINAQPYLSGDVAHGNGEKNFIEMSLARGVELPRSKPADSTSARSTFRFPGFDCAVIFRFPLPASDSPAPVVAERQEMASAIFEDRHTYLDFCRRDDLKFSSMLQAHYTTMMTLKELFAEQVSFCLPLHYTRILLTV